MSLMKSKKEESSKAAVPKRERKTLENAYVIPAQIGDQFKSVLQELPMKHAGLVGPILQYLEKQAYRVNMTLDVPVEQKKSTPSKSQSIKEEKDLVPKEEPTTEKK